MKYLNKYNEEISSQAYRDAAKELQYDHPVRAAALLKHAEFVDNQEKLKKLKDVQKSVEEFGVFNVTIIRRNVTEEVFTGNFYLKMAVETDWFKDSLNDWISDGMNWSVGIAMEFGLVPADEETYLALEKSDNSDLSYLKNNWLWENILWVNRLWVTLADKNLQQHVIVSEFEDKDGFEFIFNTRPDARRFIKLLSDTLKGDSNWSSWTRKDEVIKVCDEFKNAIVIDEVRWAYLLARHFYEHRLEAYERIITEFEEICGFEFDMELKPHENIVKAVEHIIENGLQFPLSWPKNPFTEELHALVLESVPKLSQNKFYRTV